MRIFLHRNRSYRRRSLSRNSRDVQRIPSPPKLSATRKSPPKDVQPPQKKSDEPDDIAELERRVQEAKKVLEVMVKEKMKEKQRSSSTSSSERRKRNKKRSKKKRDSSDSD